MMRWFLLFTFALSGQGFAQQINIRSGTHASFSRMVLDVPSGTSWTTDEIENGIRLELDEHFEGFDISRIFNKIDRTFISNVSADETGINVEFSCDCTADVFTEGTRMIVLDVSAAPDILTTETNSPDLIFTDQRPLRFRSADEQSLPAKFEEKPALHSMNFAASDPSNRANNSASKYLHTPSWASDAGQLNEAQNELSSQIGAAATRGILTPSHQVFELGATSPQPQVDIRIFDSSLSGGTLSVSPESATGNIKITSSSDAPHFVGGRLQTPSSTAFSCINPDLIDIENWGYGTNLPVEVARLRGQLFGEFDRLNHSITIKLAKLYLHYGFGAEAKQILLLDGAIAQSHPALMDIAEIMEFGHSRQSSYLEQFADCDSSAALWSILSMQNIEPGKTINTKAALLGLSSLPFHLRTFIAAELSLRFIAYGNQDAASAALRSLERAPDALSPNALFAKATIEMAKGEVTLAQERLSDVVASNSEQSAEALIEYVNSHLNQDAEIEEQVATLVEAYAMEMRNSAIGNELENTHVLALGKSGQFSAAFTTLSRIKEYNTEGYDNALRSTILDLLFRNASDTEFLDHTFTQLNSEPETISAKTRFHLAQRLAKLGFYKQSETTLMIDPRYSNNSENKMLRAQIALALSRPHEALEYLIGETSQSAEELRALAEMGVGNFSTAHSIYKALGDETNSRRTAWLSNDWIGLVEEDASIFGPVVSVSQDSLEGSPDISGMLERTSSSISESQQARKLILDLLSTDDSDISEN